MNKTKQKGLLPRVELLVIGVFVLSFMIWAMSKCNRVRDEYATETLTEEQEEQTEASATASTEPTAQENTSQEQTQQPTPKTIREKYTPLYVTINNFKMRAEPKLSARIVAELKLFEEVIFLNEVTDFKQEINLGFEVANEPWVKVKTERGYVGWVYGAGVHYYKIKREPEKETSEPESEN
ncbi:MAG: SH3 domain-containing protein [Bacteroidota bacterium]